MAFFPAFVVGVLYDDLLGLDWSPVVKVAVAALLGMVTYLLVAAALVWLVERRRRMQNVSAPSPREEHPPSGFGL